MRQEKHQTKKKKNQTNKLSGQKLRARDKYSQLFLYCTNIF